MWKDEVVEMLKRVVDGGRDLDEVLIPARIIEMKKDKWAEPTIKELFEFIIDELGKMGKTWGHYNAVKSISYFSYKTKDTKEYTLKEYVDWLTKNKIIEINSSDLSVYHYFLRFMTEKKDTVTTNYKVIQSRTLVSTRTIQRSIKRLIDAGLLSLDYLSNTSGFHSIYKVAAIEKLIDRYGNYSLKKSIRC